MVVLVVLFILLINNAQLHSSAATTHFSLLLIIFPGHIHLLSLSLCVKHKHVHRAGLGWAELSWSICIHTYYLVPMVRSLPKFSVHKIPFLPVPLITFFIVLISIFSIFSIITFLCASHKFTGSQRRKELVKTVRLGSDQNKSMSKLQSNISSKALLMIKMISWRKAQDHEDQEGYDDDDDEAVWKRTIIMGERCRPLEFSGKILYDSHGNPLPDN